MSVSDGMKIGLMCAYKTQSEVRRSAERYQAACEACDRSKQTLINIEQQASSKVGDSFSADKQESLNRANDEVSVILTLFIMLVITTMTTILWPLCRSAGVSWHHQLRRFYWSKVLRPTYPC